MTTGTKAFRFLSRIALRHPLGVVSALCLSLVPAVWLSSGLEFKETFADLLPRNFPSVSDLDVVLERTGGTAFVVVAVDAKDRKRAEHFADALKPRLEAIDSVLFVEGKLELDFVRDRRLLYLEPAEIAELTDDTENWLDRYVLSKAGLFVDIEDQARPEEMGKKIAGKLEGSALPVEEYLVGKDGRYLYLFVRLRGFTGDLEFGRRALSAIERETQALVGSGEFPKNLDVRFSGSVPVREEEHRLMQRDLQVASTIGFVGVALVIALLTRRARALILVSVPMLVGMAWTFALAHVLYGHLNIITGFLAAILSGLGMDYSMHLFLRYLEERRGGHDADEATHRAMELTGRSMLGGAMTTASAFFVIYFADFVGYREFGVIASLGVLITAVLTLVLFPALNRLVERVRDLRLGNSETGTTHQGIDISISVRWAVLAVTLVFSAYSCLQLATGKVKFHTNWRELKGDSPVSDFEDYIIKTLGTSNTLTLALLEDPSRAGEVKAALEAVRTERTRRGEKSAVKRSLGVFDVVPQDQDARAEQLAKLRHQLERVREDQLSEEDRSVHRTAVRLANAKPFTFADLPDSLTQRFRTADGKGTLVSLFTDNLFYEVDEIIAWADEMSEIRAELTRRGIDVHVMSENWIAGTVFGIILGDGPFILWSAFLVVFAVLLVDFRSLKHALIVMSPLVLGVVSIAGWMSLLDIQLNFMNAVVLPSIIGIGIDSAIHIYHRYLEGGPSSVPIVLRRTSIATFISTATTLVGFGALIVAHHRGIRSVGQLALLGTLTTYVTTSIVFPLALQTFGQLSRKKSLATLGCAR